MRIYVIEQRAKGSQDEWKPRLLPFSGVVDAVTSKEWGDLEVFWLASNTHEFRLMPYERMEVQP